jgi:hypothetical protein
VRLLIDDRGYVVQAETRSSGVASLFSSFRQEVQAEGRWFGHAVQPLRFSSTGEWNGRQRRVEIGYRGAEPELRLLDPPYTEERLPVPQEQRRGAMDVIAALASMVRIAGATGRCDGAVAVFDGRRRFDWSSRTEAPAGFALAGGQGHGPQLRCAFTTRLVAGFRHGDDPAVAGRPRSGIATLAVLRPGMPPLPVRIEMGSGFFGTLRAELVRIEASDQQARQ